MSETPNKLVTLDDIPGMTAARKAEAESGTRAERGVITISEADFNGDPSRVLGHPSNRNSAVSEALASHFDEIAAQRAADGGQILRVASPDMISNVPFAVPAEQQTSLPQQLISEVPSFDQH